MIQHTEEHFLTQVPFLLLLPFASYLHIPHLGNPDIGALLAVIGIGGTVRLSTFIYTIRKTIPHLGYPDLVALLAVIGIRAKVFLFLCDLSHLSNPDLGGLLAVVGVGAKAVNYIYLTLAILISAPSLPSSALERRLSTTYISP